MERLLAEDPLTGMRAWHVYDEAENRTAIRTEADVAPVLERNKRLQNEPYRHDFWWRVASIPLIVAHKWLVEDGLNIFDPAHADGLRRKLNDPDWRWLRTSRFTV